MRRTDISRTQSANIALGFPSTFHLPGLSESLQVASFQEKSQYGAKALADLSSEEFKEWLQPKLEEKGLPSSILETFLDADIDGQVFENLTEDNLKDLLPDMKFGTRKKLFLLKTEAAGKVIDKPKTQPSRGHSLPVHQRTEYARRFGMKSQVSEKYHQGKILNIHEARTTSLTDPVRQFCACTEEDATPSMYEDLADSVVVFASACLNDRQNGTIYFGIGDVDCEGYSYGEVLGFPFDKKSFDDAVTHCINRRFHGEAEKAAALKCIKPVMFLDVVHVHSTESCDLYVCEVDIEPQASIVKDLPFFLNTRTDGEENEEALYRFDSLGKPVKQTSSQLIKFQADIPNLDKERQTQEKTQSTARKTNLIQSLRNYLCGGGDKLDGGLHPLLVIPTVSISQDDFEETFKFIFDMDWHGIFDFDPESDKDGLYEYLVNKTQNVYKIKAPADFLSDSASSHQSSRNNPDEHFQGMTESHHKTWIFCNGFTAANEEGLSVAEWKKKQRSGFRKAVEFFQRSIPSERAIVLIVLSSCNDVLVEASEELLLSFEHQWLAIAQSDQIAEAWVDGLSKRDVKVDRERCLFGFSMSDISKAIQQLQGHGIPSHDVCIVKSSSGIERQLPKLKENEMCDLDIISCRQCCTAETLSEEESSDLSKDTEEEFYKGNTPSFWNFYFDGHVCRRDKYPALLDYTKETLREDAPDKGNVRCVAVYHQPGAGGTTVAMNVLWDLHSEYTCCMAKQITRETGHQIVDIYEFAGSTTDDRNPVLLLLDNEDDEKVDDLKRDIDDECDSRGIGALVCVFLLCSRRIHLPQDHELKCILLEQSVSVRERQFFLDKYSELKQKGKGQASLDSLLGLNIMKENFNEEYIMRTVSTYSQLFQRPCEKTLLRYIALLNSFDLSFRAVAVSCFDPLMQQGTHKWEGDLTKSPLLTFTSTTKLGGRNKCLRVTSKLLCKYILNANLPSDMSVGDLMEQFLHSPVFNRRSEDVAYKELLVIVRDMMKKREWSEKDRRSTFSPFIQMHFDNNECEIVTRCIQLVYEHSEDPILAQQLARFHIACKMWDDAERWAKEATEKWPSSSYLWDTRGQCYRFRLMEIRDECEASHDPPDDNTVANAVMCAYEGYQTFGTVQELSRNENVNPPNAAGYFGQMDIIVLLVKILKYWPCFQSMDELHEFFAGQYVPRNLENSIPEHYISWLQSLIDRYHICMRSVEEIRDQYPWDSSYGQSSSKVFLSPSNLERYSLQFSELFFEEDPMAVDPQKCSPGRRQRLMRKLGGHSLSSVMNLHRQDGGKEKVRKILQISSLNLNEEATRNRRYGLSMALASALALISCHDDFGHPPVPYANLLKWSLDLFNLKAETQYVDLDPFVYLLALHWPMDHRLKLPDQCEPATLTNATKLAQEAFDKKFQRGSENRKQNLPLFFLTKEPANRSIISRNQLQNWSGRGGGTHVGVNKMVKNGRAMYILNRFRGLLKNGLVVKVTLESRQGHKMEMQIPVLRKISTQTLWNKEVYFVLGIGPGGPVACDVSAQLPHMTQHAAAGPENLRPPVRPNLVLFRVEVEIESLRQRLMFIQHLRRKLTPLTPVEIQALREEPQIRARLKQLFAQRRQDVLYSIP